MEKVLKMPKYGGDYHFDEKEISIILDYCLVSLALLRKTCQCLPYVNENEGGCSDHGSTPTRDKITVWWGGGM